MGYFSLYTHNIKCNEGKYVILLFFIYSNGDMLLIEILLMIFQNFKLFINIINKYREKLKITQLFTSF